MIVLGVTETHCATAAVLADGASSVAPPRSAGAGEDVLLRWSRLMHQRYGGRRLALGGGVFMNVKANMLIGQEDWVEEMFVFPSCGDESNAVGAAYLGYVQECARRGVPATPKPFGPAYLGPR